MNEPSYNKFLAKTLYGLEEVLAEELKNSGAKNITVKNRAVEFEGNKETLYLTNLSLRTALRILVPVRSFIFKNTDEFYTKAKNIKWFNYLNPNHTFAVDAVVNSKIFKHTKYPALKLKDAIVDRIRDKTGKRPDVDTVNPKLKIHLHIQNNKCNIYLDSSGKSLHRRGYRIEGGSAPLNEVLAAGMILLTGWKGDTNFLDPMCGSGTLVAEAAMLAANIPPNLNRNDFGFMNWNDFDENMYNKIKTLLKEKIRKPEIKIGGSDISKKAIAIARKNISRAGLNVPVTLTVKDFTQISKNGESGIIVTNPPYGERLKSTSLIELYKSFGDVLKQNFTGYEAWILSGDKTAIKHVGLRPAKKLTLYNGAIECKFHKFEIYKGTKKKRLNNK